MSSFVSLRSDRKNKESRSLVSGGTDGSASTDTDNVQEALDLSITKIGNKTNEPQAEPLYAALPSNLEIRVTSTNSRGIWTKTAVSAGQF